MSIGIVSCTTIDPYTVGSRLTDAFILVGTFNRCSIVTVAAEAYFRCHAVRVAYLVIFAETVVSSVEVHLV